MYVKRVVGFILFWIAVGMTIALLIKSKILSTCLILFFLVLSYCFFCCSLSYKRKYVRTKTRAKNYINKCF